VSVLTIDTSGPRWQPSEAPRKLRIQYPGAVYDALNRGDRREAIFKDDQDRERFLITLGEACPRADWQAHACRLMNNH
jgi:hypothetical protein